MGNASRPVKAYHHGDLRRALLAAAVALLEARGADALSVREVARVAGVSPRAPYNHFTDREALLAAVAADGFSALGDALEAADAGAPPGREVEEQALAYVRFARAAPARFQLMFGPRRAAADDALTTAKRAAFAAPGRRLGEAADDPAARAMGGWALVHGLAVLFLDGRVQEELEGDEEAVVRRVTAATLGRG